MRGTEENMHGGVRFLSTEGAEGARAQFYPPSNGRSYRKKNEVMKG